MGVLEQIVTNKTIVVPSLAWFIAQVAKVFTEIIIHKKINFKRLVGSGGMPSSHSAFVVALAVAVGRIEGWGSAIFGITFVIALVVMYDAAGVRRAAGKQAQVLNKLMDESMKGHAHVDERLKELLGHSPFEVFIGAILGALFGWYLV